MKCWHPVIILSLALLCGCNQEDAKAPPVPAKSACAQEIEGIREKFAADLRAGNIDQPVFDRINAQVDEVQKICASGDEDRVRVLLMQVVFNEQLGSDETYGRKVNKKSDGK